MFCIQNEKDVIDKFIIFFAAKIIFSTKLKSDFSERMKTLIFFVFKMKEKFQSIQMPCYIENNCAQHNNAAVVKKELHITSEKNIWFLGLHSQVMFSKNQDPLQMIF